VQHCPETNTNGVSLKFSASGQLVFIGGQNVFELNFFLRKTFLRMSNQVGKIFLAANLIILVPVPQ